MQRGSRESELPNEIDHDGLGDNDAAIPGAADNDDSDTHEDDDTESCPSPMKGILPGIRYQLMKERKSACGADQRWLLPLLRKRNWCAQHRLDVHASLATFTNHAAMI